jgi:hypothetical protein
VIAQQWELYSNYLVLVVAAGLLAGAPRPEEARRGHGRALVAAVAWALLVAFLLAGHRLTYDTFLATNLLSVAQARAHAEAVDRMGEVSAVVLPHFWDDALFRLRATDAAPVLGGFWWMMKNHLSGLDPGETWDSHYARNAARVDAGYETLARREIDAAALERALWKEIGEGVCWPTVAYFYSEQDCWSRFSNYVIDPSARIAETIGAIVDGYRRHLDRMATNPGAMRVLVITREPLDLARASGRWHYDPAAEIHVKAGSTEVSAYAYLQTPDDAAREPATP